MADDVNEANPGGGSNGGLSKIILVAVVVMATAVTEALPRLEERRQLVALPSPPEGAPNVLLHLRIPPQSGALKPGSTIR